MTKLSVNVNKIATLRNSRGADNPNVVKVALDAEVFGAHGITVHPRPDERHIRYQDVLDLSPMLRTEFNIEGNPDDRFTELVLRVKPHQVTLVPDAPGALTSNAGWDCVQHFEHVSSLVSTFKNAGIRVSIFVGTDLDNLRAAARTGADRVELYTEPYAVQYPLNRKKAVEPFVKAAELAHSLGLGINAGHDLSLENLAFFKANIPYLDEVSIGHALVADALYVGLETAIKKYLDCLK